jgi:hypothetical protein
MHRRRGVRFEDSEDGVEQFASERDDGLEFSLVSGLEQFIEGLHVVAAGSREGGHIEGASSDCPATDSGGFVDRCSRGPAGRDRVAKHGNLAGGPATALALAMPSEVTLVDFDLAEQRGLLAPGQQHPTRLFQPDVNDFLTRCGLGWHFSLNF